jgi:hypothetical protein
VNTVAIHYRSVGQKYVVEVIEFDEPVTGSPHSALGNAEFGADLHPVMLDSHPRL